MTKNSEKKMILCEVTRNMHERIHNHGSQEFFIKDCESWPSWRVGPWRVVVVVAFLFCPSHFCAK